MTGKTPEVIPAGKTVSILRYFGPDKKDFTGFVNDRRETLELQETTEKHGGSDCFSPLRSFAPSAVKVLRLPITAILSPHTLPTPPCARAAHAGDPAPGLVILDITVYPGLTHLG